MKKGLLVPLCLCFLLSPFFLSTGYAIQLPDGMTVNKTLPLGGQTSGNIVIANNGKEAETVRIYQTDYMFSADGKNNFGSPGSMPRSNAKWIKFTPNQVTVAPGEETSIFYEIAVPETSDLRGTYWSVIMVEPIPQDALKPPNPKKDKATIGVQAVFRHAVQMITHIENTGTRALQFSNKALKVQAHKTFLTIDVENVGERWLVPQLYVDVADSGGNAMKRYEGKKFRIYPGCSARYVIDLGKLNSGKYNALVIADSGENEKVFGARYILDVK